jgi:hypothetical protein
MHDRLSTEITSQLRKARRHGGDLSVGDAEPDDADIERGVLQQDHR